MCSSDLSWAAEARRPSSRPWSGRSRPSTGGRARCSAARPHRAAAYYEYIKGVRHGYDLNAVPNLKLGERI